MNRRVATGANEHVDVVAHLDGVDLNVVEVLILLRNGCSNRERRADGECCGDRENSGLSEKSVCSLIMSATLLLLCLRQSPACAPVCGGGSGGGIGAFFSTSWNSGYIVAAPP